MFAPSSVTHLCRNTVFTSSPLALHIHYLSCVCLSCTCISEPGPGITGYTHPKSVARPYSCCALSFVGFSLWPPRVWKRPLGATSFLVPSGFLWHPLVWQRPLGFLWESHLGCGDASSVAVTLRAVATSPGRLKGGWGCRLEVWPRAAK